MHLYISDAISSTSLLLFLPWFNASNVVMFTNQIETKWFILSYPRGKSIDFQIFR